MDVEVTIQFAVSFHRVSEPKEEECGSGRDKGGC